MILFECTILLHYYIIIHRHYYSAENWQNLELIFVTWTFLAADIFYVTFFFHKYFLILPKIGKVQDNCYKIQTFPITDVLLNAQFSLVNALFTLNIGEICHFLLLSGNFSDQSAQNILAEFKLETLHFYSVLWNWKLVYMWKREIYVLA